MRPPSRLRVEHLENPVGLATAEPRFSWWLPPGLAAQEGYDLDVMDRDGATVWSVSVASSQSVLVPYTGPRLASGAEYHWRVRVSAAGEVSPWSEARFELSLLRQEEWHAAFVEPVQVAVTRDGPERLDGDWVFPDPVLPVGERLHPVQLLRQEFQIPGQVTRARLYATALGVYSAELNGRVVGDQVLAPGYESYDRSLSFQCYDVTELLSEGSNVLGVQLGDGWYAGRIAFTGNSAQYGDRLRASWQLVIESDAGPVTVVSDESVISTDAGPLRYSDIFIGERYDARAELVGWSQTDFDASGWQQVSLSATRPRLVPFDGEPVRRVATVPAVEVLMTPLGETVIDFGQVIAGRVRMRVVAEAGTEIRLEHSEVLDASGNFFDNIGMPNKEQTDFYVARGDEEGEVWEPHFTFHGFRYVRLTGYPGTPQLGDFVAVVLSSDLERSGSFECSDPTLNRLQQNIVWSQRGNFLSVPTDCPQRERAGWTGDLQIFAATAVTNMASGAFLRRWMHNLRLDQLGDGTVPVIIPTSPAMAIWQDPDDPLMSIAAAAGWGDAVVIVPWTIYERYGDERILEENYDAMSAWVARQVRSAGSGVPDRLAGVELSDEQRARQALLWNNERNFGDWLAPSVIAAATSLNDILEYSQATGELVGALFHGRSAELLGRAATVLGRHDEALHWAEHASRVRQAFVEEYLDENGHLLVEKQGTLVLALAFGFIPESHNAATVERLVELVREAGGHLDTGFLSVPYLLDALVAGGRADVARELLWQRTAPSWLYEVEHGATTIWEQWDAIRPDGTVGQGSYNHYAFGCVGDWLYRHVAGIQALEPGYRRSRIQPDFAIGLDEVVAHHDTPYGRVAVEWRRTGDSFDLHVDVPSGTVAELSLPAEARDIRVDGAAPLGTLAPGRHGIQFVLA